MNKTNILDITNMVMVYDDEGNILVQNRKKSDWPGINFPGGHVESGETIVESACREMREETGLLIKPENLESCGYYEWRDTEKGIRYIAFLFRTNIYEGEIKNSIEGDTVWIKYNEIDNYDQSIDFDKLFFKMKNGLTCF